MSEYGIVSVSDISLGYGSPQITAFLQSMAEFYDTRAFVLETDEPHRPPTSLKNAERIDVRRAISAQPYCSLSAHIERNFEILDVINEYRPHTLIFFSPLQLPVVRQLSYKPRVILYLLEIDAGMYTRALSAYEDVVDHYIFPEYERLRHVLGQLNKRPYPKSSLIYNCVSRAEGVFPVAPDKRNGRIIYAGTLSQELTFAHEFLGAPLNALPIDIYGNFSGEYATSLRATFLTQAKSEHVVYQGYVPNGVLRRALPQYAYSFVRWDPSAGINYHYACPNKFFEAIAAGVPPIAAPHPQCAQIIDTYECGILAEDYTAEAMHEASIRALGMLGTLQYDRMVERCLSVYEDVFNWPKQFFLFAQSLPSKEQLCA